MGASATTTLRSAANDVACPVGRCLRVPIGDRGPPPGAAGMSGWLPFVAARALSEPPLDLTSEPCIEPVDRDQRDVQCGESHPALPRPDAPQRAAAEPPADEREERIPAARSDGRGHHGDTVDLAGDRRRRPRGRHRGAEARRPAAARCLRGGARARSRPRVRRDPLRHRHDREAGDEPRVAGVLRPRPPARACTAAGAPDDGRPPLRSTLARLTAGTAPWLARATRRRRWPSPVRSAVGHRRALRAALRCGAGARARRARRRPRGSEHGWGGALMASIVTSSETVHAAARLR